MVLQVRGGPYRPTDQASGEIPSQHPDVAISAVLLVLFLVLGVAHLALFIRNLKRGHKFIFNEMCVALSMVRIITFSLRIDWAFHPTNIKLGIAAGIFVYAGTVLLFIGNLFFAQRIIRAQHSRFGWSKPATIFVRLCIVWIVLTLLMVVVAVTQSFFTLSKNTLRIDRDLELYCQTVYAIIAFLPIPLVLISTLAGRHPGVRAGRKIIPVDKFGRGRMTHKILLVLFTAAMLTLETAFRAGSTWKTPVPSRTAMGKLLPQPWYFTKAAFYSFNFAVELIVSLSWLVFRVDLLFHVPNHSQGSYGNEIPAEKPLAEAESLHYLSDTDSDHDRNEVVMYAFGPAANRSFG